MPHERGPLPVLPSEFSTLLSPIPMLASAATRQPLYPHQREPGLTWYPLDPKALNYRAVSAARMLGSTLACERMRATDSFFERATQPRSIPPEKGMSRKDAQRLS